MDASVLAPESYDALMRSSGDEKKHVRNMAYSCDGCIWLAYFSAAEVWHRRGELRHPPRSHAFVILGKRTFTSWGMTWSGIGIAFVRAHTSSFQCFHIIFQDSFISVIICSLSVYI